MQRFFGIAQDVNGNAIPSVAVTVNLAGTGTAATLYSDNSYTPLANPFTSNTDGTYQFFAKNGQYDVVLSKTGYTFVAARTTNILLDDQFSVISPPQITTNQNDYSPTNGLNATDWRISSDAARTITGIAAGFSGQMIRLINVGSFAITLANESGSSTAANRILTGSGSDQSVAVDGSSTLVYDSSTARWRVVAVVAGTVAPLTGIFTSPGTIVGLRLLNDISDPTNDILIASGAATSDDATITDRDTMYLQSNLIKQLDVNWAVGNNQGGLDTGVIGNNTYHVWLIKRTDTGVVDALFSLSATAPSMPASYNKKRRIGAIIRSAGAILLFSQRGDEFLLGTPTLDVDDAAPGTGAVTRTLTVPVGVRVWAFGRSISTTAHIYISSLDTDDVAPSTTAAPLAHAGAFTTIGIPWGPTRTNTSAQVRSRSSANALIRMATSGWIDRRDIDA